MHKGQYDLFKYKGGGIEAQMATGFIKMLVQH